MKNLFVITEEEKNRILGLHETATNNQYLINEQSSLNLMEESSKDREVANSLGFPDVSASKNNCQKVTIFDGQAYQNLMSYVCPNGYIDFKVLSDYKNTTISGSWVVSNQNVAITMSDGTKFTGTLTPGSLYKQVTSWLVKQQKFAEYVKGQGSEVQKTWKSWGGGESQGAAQGGSGSGNQGQGWDLALVKVKYPCLSGTDFADTNVYPTPYGDVVKLNLGKDKNNQPVFGKMYLQDGYMVNWESNVRIGNEEQYMACKNNKLSFQTGKNITAMFLNVSQAQNESLNKVGNIIKEAIDTGVISAAGGISGKYSGDVKKYTGPSNAQKVQTKLKELDPSSPQTGKMDQETINKVMSLLNQGTKTPEQTYNVNQTLSNTKSDD